jgi:hypothetical protein
VKMRVIGILIAAATTVGSAAMAQGPMAQDPQAMGQPPGSMPEPPPPPQAAPSDYYAPAPVAVAAPAPAGQWVYTNQYGWVWMPYGANYTYVAGGNVAYSYAFYPHFGWRWLASPWVLGFGPSPYWGRPGPVHFAWYGHPHFRGYAPRVVYNRPVFRATVAPHVVYQGHPGHGAPGGNQGWRGGGGRSHGGGGNSHGGGGNSHGGGWHHR